MRRVVAVAAVVLLIVAVTAWLFYSYAHRGLVPGSTAEWLRVRIQPGGVVSEQLLIAKFLSVSPTSIKVNLTLYDPVWKRTLESKVEVLPSATPLWCIAPECLRGANFSVVVPGGTAYFSFTGRSIVDTPWGPMSTIHYKFRVRGPLPSWGEAWYDPSTGLAVRSVTYYLVPLHGAEARLTEVSVLVSARIPFKP